MIGLPFRLLNWKGVLSISPILVLGIFILIWLSVWIEVWTPGLRTSSQEILSHYHQITSDLSKLQLSFSKPGPIIWLIWTTHESTFQLRNLKVLDAYLFHHPNAQIRFLSSHMSILPFQHHLSSSYQIELIPLTNELLQTWSKSCPGEDWIQNLESWKDGPWFYSHVSDWIRFCVLYREGGVYSDLDALALNPFDFQLLNSNQAFIGKDSSGGNGKCEWCLPGGDAYLAPGVMGSTSNHSLPREALRIGFEQNYDMNTFNAVGPKAVTLSYKQNSTSTQLLDPHKFYPYRWNEAFQTLNYSDTSLGELERLRSKSLSLHLYGHATRNKSVEDWSLVDRIFNKFSVVVQVEERHRRVTGKKGGLILSGPEFLGVRNSFHWIRDIRVIYEPGVSLSNLKGSTYKVKINSHGHGLLYLLQYESPFPQVFFSNLTTSLTFMKDSLQELNHALSGLLYIPPPIPYSIKQSRISISILVAHPTFESIPLKLELQVLHVVNLVTMIVKTVGRMDKVFNLIQSAHQRYPNLKILVADDIANNTRKSGTFKGFEYLALEEDIGLSEGRNLMVQRVQTDYFLTLDDDFTLDNSSSIESLLWPLITSHFDIAAGKNPVDEDKFKLDFCGFLKVDQSTQTLHLIPGTYPYLPVYQSCQHVDFVPNIFLGLTHTFQSKIQWDKILKVGEHEDFFLRAKGLGVKTLTCPGVSFVHNQVPHWLGRTKYDKLRSRVYEFWKTSLAKHGLKRLVSFGTVMMDINIERQVSQIQSPIILPHSLILSWKSLATSFNVLIFNPSTQEWIPVNGGEGSNYQKGNEILIGNLLPESIYLFKVFAGNGFVWETLGREIRVKTISTAREKEMTILVNGDFELGHFGFFTQPPSLYHIISSPHSPSFTGRLQIQPRSYTSPTPTLFLFSQTLTLSTLPLNQSIQSLTLVGHSKLEELYAFVNVIWELEVVVRLKSEIPSQHGVILMERSSFDVGSWDWQARRVHLCFWSRRVRAQDVDKITINARFGGYRGSVLWDHFTLLVNGEGLSYQ